MSPNESRSNADGQKAHQYSIFQSESKISEWPHDNSTYLQNIGDLINLFHTGNLKTSPRRSLVLGVNILSAYNRQFQYFLALVLCYICPRDSKISCPDRKEDVSNLKSHLHVPSLLYALPGCNGLQLEGCSLLLQISNLTEPLIHIEDTADRKSLITHTIGFFCPYLSSEPQAHYFQK